ncbi:hypothetical protein P691DRAFT_513560 [Macrolepiota fuliginosa MF-IS2]|uniref:Nephrocystin 3-like N-terminal domain-containing protein n=1 Tax=Macrolepiota fuliginosa MF-IS2 TaxID=1400762 RepID=A0A9P5WZT5_9AGAR|nr:hypothetical protein P691DRAFT_513560 [Macrolepiota fuliginosa MF-IS2]
MCCTMAPIDLPTSGFFSNAHNFSIGQLNAIQSIEAGTTALQHLMEKGIPAAIHDSYDRAYPPQCHPSTRRSLRERVVKWGMGDGSDGRMLWVLGVAAVGKSAVAQTIAEEFQAAGRLGASFFFSRPNHVNDPDAVIPTLVYQLATKIPQYKHIINIRLADDPWILKKNHRALFRELMIEPFHILMTQYPHAVPQPLLIILDGLDECMDKRAQCEFIDLISTHVRQVGKFPLQWMICSRPEWHLESLLSDTDFCVVCKREELQLDDGEAREDVRCLLEAGFDKIRKRYKDRLPNDWPPERCFYGIVGAVSGHLGFVSFVLRFIGDEEHGDPNGQLKVCMRFLLGDGVLVGISPLHALELLYRQILSDVPADDLPTTMRVLGFLLSFSYAFPKADDYAMFLGLSPGKFHRSLERLRSVLYVTPADQSTPTPIHIYHTSFPQFLMNRARSGKFYLDLNMVNHDTALQCLHWLENNHESPLTQHVSAFCARYWWVGCGDIMQSNESITGIVNRLECFDFTRLLGSDALQGSAQFLRWLYSLRSPRNKSIITVVEETGQPLYRMHASPYKPREYISWFIPEPWMLQFSAVEFPAVELPAVEFPFTLKLRLGRSLRCILHSRFVMTWINPTRSPVRCLQRVDFLLMLIRNCFCSARESYSLEHQSILLDDFRSEFQSEWNPDTFYD